MKIKKSLIYILFFVIGILTFSTSNVSKIIAEIRREVNKIDKNMSLLISKTHDVKKEIECLKD